MQYEILSLGLKGSMVAQQPEKRLERLDLSEGERIDRSINNIEDGAASSYRNGRQSDSANKGLYANFATFYVDDKENLKEILR